MQKLNNNSSQGENNNPQFRGGIMILPDGTALVSLHFDHGKSEIPLREEEEGFNSNYEPLATDPQDLEDISDL